MGTSSLRGGEVAHAQKFQQEVSAWSRTVKKQKPTSSPKTTPTRQPRLYRRLERFGGMPQHEPIRQARRGHYWKKILRWGGALVAAAMLIIAIPLYGVGTHDDVSLAVAGALRLPAGIVNGSIIPLDHWIRGWQSIEQQAASQAEVAGLQPLVQSQARSLMFDQLVEETLLRTLADHYGVRPTADDFSRTKQELAASVGSEAALDQELWDRYNWDEETFLRLVVQPQTLKRQVGRAIVLDESINAAAKAAAGTVVSRLQSGAPADRVVAELQGTTATVQDTGYVRYDQLGPVIAVWAWRESVGSVLAPIATPDGYSIWVIQEQLRDDRGVIAYVRLQEIRVPGVTLQTVLDQERSQAKVYRFVRW